MQTAILGYGTVGSELDLLLQDHKTLRVTRIFSRHMTAARDKRAASFEEILQDPAIDTVAEMLGGVEPALSYMEAALKAGKNVVSSNKAAVAAGFSSLARLAHENGVSFRFTAAVGGGIPWLPNLERLKRADRVQEIGGIMNGTCNYILDQMTKAGKSFETVLGQAQALGFAERDPSADIDGADTRRKLTISMNTAFEAVFDEQAIPCFGIRHVTGQDIETARSGGFVIRLLARSFRNADGSVRALIAPAFVPSSAPEAAVPDNFNRISCALENGGPFAFFGQGAGGRPTALNVLHDLEDISVRRAVFYQSTFEAATVKNQGFAPCWYVRLGTESFRTQPTEPEALAAQLAGKEYFAAILPEERRESPC